VWGWAKNSFKQHYFEDGRSLCGRYWQTFEWDWSDMSLGRCRQCQEALRARGSE